ncbi:MAG: sigma-54 dependent transcriptional regulator [Rickettsiales bacterium]|nr:sigma-54 dependent transcriptional regulator [Rickettsiales bacterium]
MQTTILLIEDERFQASYLSKFLKNKLSFETLVATNARESLTILKEQNNIINLVILDLGLPDMHGLELLDIIKQRYPEIPVIILTASEKVDHTVTAIKKGAVDFIKKPFEIERLSVSINNAIRMTSLSNELSRMQRFKDKCIKFSDLVGYDGGLEHTIKVARKASSSDIPVLITGETGVGKELFSMAIHGESRRSGKPFVAVNCGAIPSQLVESILFGHEKGAFTGAVNKSAGKFREANGGTIFLDEIGELPLDIQTKLLRVLQQKEVEPVGSGNCVPVDVRVISATNRNLPLEVQNSNFREDLFFRLDGLPIRIPSLRERSQDIQELANHFLEHFSTQDNLPFKSLSSEALTVIQSLNWPGNIRELENTIHRAIIMSNSNTVTKEDIQSVIRNRETSDNIASHTDEVAKKTETTLTLINSEGSITTMDELEKEAMMKIMNHFNGNITASSKALNIAKSTFYRKMNNFHPE